MGQGDSSSSSISCSSLRSSKSRRSRSATCFFASTAYEFTRGPTENHQKNAPSWHPIGSHKKQRHYSPSTPLWTLTEKNSVRHMGHVFDLRAQDRTQESCSVWWQVSRLATRVESESPSTPTDVLADAALDADAEVPRMLLLLLLLLLLWLPTAMSLVAPFWPVLKIGTMMPLLAKGRLGAAEWSRWLAEIGCE